MNPRTLIDLITHTSDQFHRSVGRTVQLLDSEDDVDYLLITLYGKLLCDLARRIIPDENLSLEQRVMALAVYVAESIAAHEGRDLHASFKIEVMAPLVMAIERRMRNQ